MALPMKSLGGSGLLGILDQEGFGFYGGGRFMKDLGVSGQSLPDIQGFGLTWAEPVAWPVSSGQAPSVPTAQVSGYGAPTIPHTNS
jgi:hypothetical protein